MNTSDAQSAVFDLSELIDLLPCGLVASEVYSAAVCGMSLAVAGRPGVGAHARTLFDEERYHLVVAMEYGAALIDSGSEGQAIRKVMDDAEDDGFHGHTALTDLVRYLSSLTPEVVG